MKDLKKAKTIKEQIDMLKEKGVVVDDEQYATRILSRINYYRISGYILPFKEKLGRGEKIKFKRIIRILGFDQLLRNLILKYVEHIEISLRTFIVRSLAFRGDANGMAYRDKNCFRSEEEFKKWIDGIDDVARQSDEPFMVHYKREYSGKYPIWVILEVVPIGKLSRMYELLNKDIQIHIANCYNGIHYKRLVGYLKSISYLRNKCAHHSRIYYRFFNKVQLPNLWYKEKELVKEKFTNKRLMSQLYMLKDLCVDENVWSSSLAELEKLVENYKYDIDIKHLGFEEGWADKLKSKCI